MTGDGPVEALKNINITIPDGDIFGIIGMSGAGKSTLVRTINMLEVPTEGDVIIDGVSMKGLSKKDLREARKNITMIFQGFNLLQQRTVIDNVMFPLTIAGVKKEERKAKALEYLSIVGLEEKADAYPSQLSGGQQQRVAIARALMTNPKILLCDEATSALDPNTTQQILDLLVKINQEMGITIVVITHQMSVVESICKHVAILDMGEKVEEGSVGDIFANPKSKAARRLVMPDSEDFKIDHSDANKFYIRLVFNGNETTDQPLIAQMAVEKGIMASIAYASTKMIGGKVFGNMILSINGDEQKKQETLDYLHSMPGLTAEEVVDHEH